MNNFFIKLKKGSKIVFNKDTEICVTKYGENTIITLKNNSCDIVIQDNSNQQYIRKSIDEIIQKYKNSSINVKEVDRSFGFKRKKSTY